MKGIFLNSLIVLFMVFVPAGCSSSFSDSPNILLTGYWPPTNQMLRQFSADPQINPDGWQGKNWNGSGYDVYAFFPAYSGDPKDNPAGQGDMRVDYQATAADFERITGVLHPVAIIGFGQGAGPWEIEYNAVNLSEWVEDYNPPVLPDAVPVDKSVAAGFKRNSTLPVQRIADAIDTADIGVKSWVDWDGDAGNFICNYLAYQAFRYQDGHKDTVDQYPCMAAGFIHVSEDMPLDKAVKATEITLSATIDYLDLLRASQDVAKPPVVKQK